MKLNLKPFGSIHVILGIFLAMLLLQAASAETQFTNEFWISTAVQTNGGAGGVYGNGTLDCPFDGSTQTKFDSVMHYLSYDAYMRYNSTIHVLAGTYQTLGTSAPWPSIGWRLQNGQKLLGSGIDNTIIQLVTNAASGSYVIWCYPSGCSNVEVADLTLDCNYAPALGAVSFGGLILNGTSLAARRIKVVNVSCADPNREVGGINFLTGGTNSDGNLIEECEVDVAPGQCGDGIGFDGVSSDFWISGIIRNNRMIFTAITNQAGNMSTIGCAGAWMRNTLIEGNYVKGPVGGFYGDTGGYTNIIVAHNVFENCVYSEFIASPSRQNIMFCYNTISYTIPNFNAGVVWFVNNASYTNIAIIGNTVTYNGNLPGSSSQFIWMNNITGLIVANNMVQANLPSAFSGCTGVSMYFNYDLNGNLRTDLDTMGFSTMTTYGRSLMSSASQSAALVNLGLPSNPAILLTTNQSLPVSFTANVTVAGALNYSNMVAQLLAGNGITTGILNTSTGQVVTVNANSQTNGFGNIVTHGVGEFAASTNATIWNSVMATNATATNWATLNVTSSNATITVHGTTVAVLQTNGVLNAYNGLSTTISNTLPAFRVNLIGTGSVSWTNTTSWNIAACISSFSGKVYYNNSLIFTNVTTSATLMLQPNSYFSIITLSGGVNATLYWYPF